MKNKIIEFKNVIFSYDESRILNDLSFSVPDGTFAAILGPNGSGKSTIAKLIIGLLEPQSGEVLINGCKITKDNVYKIRDNIAIVFQNPDNQFIGSTVEDDIAFSLENHCLSREEMQARVKEYAKKVGMSDYLNHEPQSLSGGQKQRVAIASSLAIKPSILILDESTSMLDPKGRHEVFELINLLRQENSEMSIIFITHYIDEVLNADLVYIINKGRLVAIDDISILKNTKLLEENRLIPPFIYQLSDKLKENGITINEVSSLDELVNKL